jgi:hypothetical protein
MSYMGYTDGMGAVPTADRGLWAVDLRLKTSDFRL